jgi:integrin beta 3
MGDISALADQMIDAVKHAVGKAYAPLSERVGLLESGISDLAKSIAALPQPQKGADGKDGRDGVDGKDGKDGVDGKDGEPGRDGKDGVDGKNGVDGKDGLSLKGEAGNDGKNGENGRDGKDGKDGKDGRDGRDLAVAEMKQMVEAAFKSIAFDFVQSADDPRQWTFTAALEPYGVRCSKEFSVPMMINRGVWVEGTTYARGDVVTWDGSSWHCEEETTQQPNRPNGKSHWTMNVKRGTPGRDGKNGTDGKKGDEGPRGRDLTQMSFDGGKH